MSIYSFLRAIVAPIQRILWPTKIIHRENFDKIKDGGIVICNHYSTPDSVILATQFFKKDLNVLVKSDVFEKKKTTDFYVKWAVFP